MKLYIVIVLICIISTANAQSLRGKVIDKVSGVPLSGVNFKTREGGTVSSADGTFILKCIDDMQLTVSFVGYETVSLVIADCKEVVTVSLNPTTQVLNEVEITATSTLNRLILYQPASITKLGMNEIRRGTGLFLDDAINNNIPGVFMQRRTIGGGQQINIRGYGGGGPGPRGVNNNFDQQGIKAYLNGVPVTDAEGITLMDDIDFGSVGNVEVTKGPSGTLYGLAIAGVVNLQTTRPKIGKTSVGQDVLFGTYGLKRFTTNFQTSSENSSLLVNYGTQYFDGFMPHTDSKKRFFNFVGDFKLSERRSFSAYAGYSNSYDARNGELTIDQYKSLDYSGNPAYIKNDAHSNVISFRLGVGHHYQITSNITNNTSLFGTAINSNVSSAGGWTDKAPMNYGLRSVFDAKFELSDNLTLTGVNGVEAQKQYAQVIAYGMVPNAADPSGYNVIGAIRSNQTTMTETLSVFSEWTLSMPFDLSITAGVGSSYMNIELIDKFYNSANNTPSNNTPSLYKTSYDNMISPHLALNKIFNREISVYTSYRIGYRAPVASSIYTPLANQANTSLKPEEGKQVELGSKGVILKDKFTYELSLFNSWFSDKMTTLAVPNEAKTATLYTYTINGGRLNNKGFELMVRYNLLSTDSGVVKYVRPFVNYTYSDFKYESFTFQNDYTKPVADYSGNRVAGVPSNVFNVGIDFSFNLGFYGNLNYQYRDAMPFTPDNLNIAPSYRLMNGKIGYRKTFANHLEVDVFFGVNNLTNSQYYQMVFINQLPDAFIPGPRYRNYFTGLNFKFIY